MNGFNYYYRISVLQHLKKKPESTESRKLVLSKKQSESGLLVCDDDALASLKTSARQEEAGTFGDQLAINGVCVNWLCNLSPLLQMQSEDVRNYRQHVIRP